MNITEAVLLFFSFLSFIPTLASISRFDQWWIRGFDFPRVQTCVLILLIYALVLFTVSVDSPWHFVILALLAINFVYQAVKIYPYTIFAKKQVKRFKGHDPNNTIAVLVSNVLTTNKKYDLLLEQVHKKKPDLLLTLETDEHWEKELSVLEKEYPHMVKIPKDNPWRFRPGERWTPAAGSELAAGGMVTFPAYLAARAGTAGRPPP